MNAVKKALLFAGALTMLAQDSCEPPDPRPFVCVCYNENPRAICYMEIDGEQKRCWVVPPEKAP